MDTEVSDVLPWRPDGKLSLATTLPLWQLIDLDPGYLKFEIERAAREFGYRAASTPGRVFGEMEATLRIELRQRFERSKP